jgi:hypothetical protein
MKLNRHRCLCTFLFIADSSSLIVPHVTCAAERYVVKLFGYQPYSRVELSGAKYCGEDEQSDVIEMRVAFRGSSSVSFASHGPCFMCIKERRDQTSNPVFPNLFDIAVPLTSLFIFHGTP